MILVTVEGFEYCTVEGTVCSGCVCGDIEKSSDNFSGGDITAATVIKLFSVTSGD